MQYTGLGTKSISADKLITTESRQAVMPLKYKSSSEKSQERKTTRGCTEAFHYETRHTGDPPLNAS